MQRTLDFCRKTDRNETIAESFYNVKNGSSFSTSKSISKNLSNENKNTLGF